MRTIYCVLLSCVFAQAGADHSDLLKQAREEYWSGHFAAAENSFRAVLRLIEPNNRRERANTLAELGDVYSNEDDLVNAESVYRESLTIYKELRDESQTARLLQRLGAVYSLERRDDEALRVLRQALKLTETNPMLGSRADVLNSIGVTYFRQGDMNKASKYFGEAVQLSPASSGLLTNLGNVYQERHKYTEAEVFLNRALKLNEEEVGPSHPDITFTLAALGALYTATGRYADAESQFKRALKILEPAKEEFDTRMARILHLQSVAYTKAGKRSEGEATLAQAAAIARRNLSGHPDMVTIVENYSASLKHQGKSKEAEELRVEARRARVIAGLVIAAH